MTHQDEQELRVDRPEPIIEPEKGRPQSRDTSIDGLPVTHGILVRDVTVTDLDEAVHLCEYEPQWPILFAAEGRRISSGLSADVTIEHIGSTAVPGLLAKPIIDIMVGTEPHHKVEAVRAALVDLGYEDMGESGVPGRIYFRRRIGADFNVALVTRGGSLWVTNLAFRDHLRTSPDARREYAETKREAFDNGIQSLLAYSDYKKTVLSRLIAEALERKLVCCF